MIRFSLKQLLVLMGFVAFFCFLFRRPIDYLIQEGTHKAILNGIRPHLWLIGIDTEYYTPRHGGVEIFCWFVAVILFVIVTISIYCICAFCIKGIWEWAKD